MAKIWQAGTKLIKVDPVVEQYACARELNELKQKRK